MKNAQTMMSMTGFAQSEGQSDGLSWRIEIKSVNGKGFDLRVRTPSGFDAFEALARTTLGQTFKRGSLTLSLNIETTGSGSARINRTLLAEVRTLAAEIGGDHRLEHLLAVRGVIDTDETHIEPSPELNKALESGLQRAVSALSDARQKEGAHLFKVLTEHLDDIARLTAAARSEGASIPVTLRDRLLARLKELGSDISADRLAQEAALLASKSDIVEELNRLEGHVAAIRTLLAGGGAIGRKLDFLCQELNREANTLCSKSETLTLTNIGVDLKVTIEQFREQVQNVE